MNAYAEYKTKTYLNENKLRFRNVEEKTERFKKFDEYVEKSTMVENLSIKSSLKKDSKSAISIN